MGAKTAMLVYADDTVATVLQGEPVAAGAEEAAAFVRMVRPGHQVESDGEEPWELGDAVYPPEGTTCALSVPGVSVVCDQGIMIDRPSQLAEHLVAASAGRRLYLHAMHSVVDWLAFAVWEDGRLVRSLSLCPDEGVMEDIGDRLPFELPYWEGAHPVEPYPPHDDEEPYALPFHPLDLGERAMLEFFGFCIEGCSEDEGAPEPTVDVWAIELHGFHVKENPQASP